MTKRVCSEPGCPELVDTGRCSIHRREHEQRRGTRQQRGYDADHDRLRAEYQRRMDQGERFTCWRCKRVINPRAWHLGHDDYDRSQHRGPECIPCNTATTPRRIPPGA